MKTRQQRRSRLQESRAARDVGGREQSGSGSSWSAKGDVRRAGELRMECKYTDKDFYQLHLKDLLKIRDEAIKGGLETPIFQIDFAQYKRKYAVLDRKLWHHIYMAQAGAGSIISSTDLFAVGGSLRLHALDLMNWHASAVKRGEDFEAAVTFQDATDKRFAVVDWDLFKRCWEIYR